MGLEARCEATLGPPGLRRSTGRAQLETTELTFRGDFRVRVPLAEIQRLSVDDGSLFVRWPDGMLTLRLGAAAAPRWAEKIRHPPSRLDKLGVKPTSRAMVVGALDDAFLDELAARAPTVTPGVASGGSVDLVFYAVAKRTDLARLRSLARLIEPDGAVWIVRPKGSADVSEQDVRAAGRAAGLVDVKVAAFSATHTADKYVIPVSARKRPTPTTKTGRSLPGDRSRSAPAKTRRR